jgi:hypothetical protein
LADRIDAAEIFSLLSAWAAAGEAGRLGGTVVILRALRSQGLRFASFREIGAAGSFKLAGIPVGVYTIRIKAIGFREKTILNFRVDSERELSLGQLMTSAPIK